MADPSMDSAEELDNLTSLHQAEAVRLYTEVLGGYEFTTAQRANVQKLLDAAKVSLKNARTDHTAISREVNKAIANGKTMTDLHDAHSKAMHDRAQFIDEEQHVRADDVGQAEKVLGVTPQLITQSSLLSVPKTAGVSQSTGANEGRSQSTAWTDIVTASRFLGSPARLVLLSVVRETSRPAVDASS
ncbi:hypothetical protein CSOJ01_05612 [Colletotrichum sojae]|uniref:Uncharacterized protein n=1 Tax=Colletotrichum sojae TaxID=2175907 RepID=A0A8H6JFC4_9PEZI|nr:hypothetical protein CSOJ01_05612 [Colletotrichum sojae]